MTVQDPQPPGQSHEPQIFGDEIKYRRPYAIGTPQATISLTNTTRTRILSTEIRAAYLSLDVVPVFPGFNFAMSASAAVSVTLRRFAVTGSSDIDFIAANNMMVVPEDIGLAMRVGDSILIASTSSNNGTFTVVQKLSPTRLILSGSVADEAGTSATIAETGFIVGWSQNGTRHHVYPFEYIGSPGQSPTFELSGTPTGTITISAPWHVEPRQRLTGS